VSFHNGSKIMLVVTEIWYFWLGLTRGVWKNSLNDKVVKVEVQSKIHLWTNNCLKMTSLTNLMCHVDVYLILSKNHTARSGRTRYFKRLGKIWSPLWSSVDKEKEVANNFSILKWRNGTCFSSSCSNDSTLRNSLIFVAS